MARENIEQLRQMIAQAAARMMAEEGIHDFAYAKKRLAVSLVSLKTVLYQVTLKLKKKSGCITKYTTLTNSQKSSISFEKLPSLPCNCLSVLTRT